MFVADEAVFGDVVGRVVDEAEKQVREGGAHDVVFRVETEGLGEERLIAAQQREVPDGERIVRVCRAPGVQNPAR